MAVRQRPGKGQKGGSQATARRPPTVAERRKAWGPGALGIAIFAALLTVIHFASGPSKPAVLLPFSGTQLKRLPQLGGQHAEELLWGTYRPGYYFGMRTRQPQSLLAGMMWVDPTRRDPLANIRHEAQQRDGLAKYGWLQHDGRSFGVQHLWDEQYNITTAWAKRLCAECAPGGDWGVRIMMNQRQLPTDQQGEGQHRRRLQEEGDERGNASSSNGEGEGEGQPAPRVASLFFYMAAEDGGQLQLSADTLAAALQQGDQQAASQPPITGSTPPFGPWQLHVGHASTSSSGSGGAILSVNYLAVPTPHMHNLTDLVREGLMASVRQQHAQGQRQYRLVLPDTALPGSNLAVIQVTALLPLELEFSFLAGPKEGSSSNSHSQLAARLAAISRAGLSSLLTARANSFQRHFDSLFGSLVTGGSAAAGQPPTRLPPGAAAVAQAALSNMLGGMGYFYGHSLVRLQRRRQGEVEESTERLWDTALYSAVPSRSFFPRGFLWDEGFHQLLIRRWDAAISRDVLAHWFDLMNSQGWIAREQILGQEARARVPDEFVRQSPDAANPPTFFLLLSDMSHRVATAAESGEWSDADLADADLLRAAWPRLRAWYLWFNTSQAGPAPGSYRWRGREPGSSRELNPKTLTSGLDDAPRASHPSEDERHVDLRCWMALATRALATIGSNLGLPRKEVQPFLAAAAWLEDFDRLNALHLDHASGEYRDWGNHTEDVELRQPMATLADGRQVPAGEMQRVVMGQPPQPQLVPQFGYISLFPLLMRLIPPDSPILGRQLDLLGDPERLWTDYGLRSLSRSASLYQQYNTQHDPPYWRGAIWINVNYMAVQALHHYAHTAGPYQARASELHHELRRNLITNIVRQYERTGYLWEQYDDSTGQGKGSHPFTGWTALVALMAADE